MSEFSLYRGKQQEFTSKEQFVPFLDFYMHIILGFITSGYVLFQNKSTVCIHLCHLSCRIVHQIIL